MLAPRKKLWTTPKEVIEKAIELLKPQCADVVYDIGCGEGQFLVKCAMACEGCSLRGLEIDSDRANIARKNIEDSQISSDRCEVIVGNALEMDFSAGSCFFLYLIPRGLKLILPLLSKIAHPIRVVTYMSPLPGVAAVQTVKVSTASHDGAQWPLFYYELSPDSWNR